MTQVLVRWVWLVWFWNRVEVHFAFRIRGRRHVLADGIEDQPELDDAIFLHFLQFGREFLEGGEHLAGPCHL